MGKQSGVSNAFLAYFDYFFGGSMKTLGRVERYQRGKVTPSPPPPPTNRALCLSHHWTEWLQKLIAYHLISKQTKRHGVGRPRTSRTEKNVHVIESRRPPWHPHRLTIPQISKETYISRRKWRHNFLVSEPSVRYLFHVGKFNFFQIWTSITWILLIELD